MKQTELEKSSTGAVKRLLNTNFEQTVEAQCVLPEFLPDIMRVVRCEGQVFVCDRQVGQDKVTLEGNLRFEVLCYSPDGELFSAVQVTPWHKMLDAALPVGSIVFDKARVVSCKARPVSPKKVELTAVIALRVTAYGPQQEQSVSKIQAPDVQTRLFRLQADRYCGGVSRQFSLSEDLELDSDAPSAERLLCTKARIAKVEARAAEGKILLSGELKVSVLYSADVESGEPQRLSYTLPINQALEADDVDAECRCKASLCLCSYALTTKTNAEGVIRSFALDCVFYAAAYCVRPEEIECVSDAFSASYASTPTYAMIAVESDGEQKSEAVSLTVPIDAGDRTLTKILESGAAVTALRTVAEDGRMRVELTVRASVLCANEEGELVWLEQRADGAASFAVPDSATVSPTAEVTAVSATQSGNTIEVRAEIAAGLEVLQAQAVGVLSDFAVDFDSPVAAQESALILCFGAAGEAVFDIAKTYHTSPDAIIRHNSLSADVLEKPTVLIIPTV